VRKEYDVASTALDASNTSAKTPALASNENKISYGWEHGVPRAAKQARGMTCGTR